VSTLVAAPAVEWRREKATETVLWLNADFATVCAKTTSAFTSKIDKAYGAKKRADTQHDF
jgi:hypothetical protein